MGKYDVDQAASKRGEKMRFIERATKALGYHRRAYSGVFIAALVFSLLSIFLLTMRAMTLSSLSMFQGRLKSLDQQAATRLIDLVQSTYRHIVSQYQLAWLGLLGVVFLLTAFFAWRFAQRRRPETAAYLMMGKSTGDIASQYVLETLLVFTVAFLAIAVLLTLLSSVLTGELTRLNRQWFDHTLTDRVSAKTFKKITTKLFRHRVTGFTGSELLFPGHNDPRQPNTGFSGLLPTYLAGILTVGLSQAITFSLSIWWAKRQLMHH